jgi:aerobic C4-dicarboxylate transport protein
MSEARALTNFIGNGVAAVVVSKWENELDMETMQRELANPSPMGEAHAAPAIAPAAAKAA